MGAHKGKGQTGRSADGSSDCGAAVGLPGAARGRKAASAVRAGAAGGEKILIKILNVYGV